MKRTRGTDRESGAIKIYPLFTWRLCDCCKNEFRREFGWRFTTGPYHGRNGGVGRYLCLTCAPTLCSVDAYIERMDGFIPPKPPPTPAPPKMKVEVGGVEVQKKPNSFSYNSGKFPTGRALTFSLPDTEENRTLIAGWIGGAAVEIVQKDGPSLKFNTGEIYTTTIGDLINIKMEIKHDE